MLRVAGTYRAYGSEYDDRKKSLFCWTAEILDAMYANTARTNTTLFHNYVDQSSTFLDASSTAAIAAATYHLAVLRDEKESNCDRLSNANLLSDADRLSNAERARHELSFGGHIDGDGWLSPVVDPYNFPKEGSHSAEGQAFVVSMYAGYREWQGASELSASELGTKVPSTEVPSTENPSTEDPSTGEPSTKEPSNSSASHASVSTSAIAALSALACILA